MDKKNIFTQLQDLLLTMGFQVRISEKNEKQPFDIALVSLGVDQKGRPHALQIQRFNQEVIPKESGLIEKPAQNLNMLSFILTAPYEISQKTQPEVLRLLALINKSLPLGCFNLSENERAVYFTYSWPLFAETPNEITLITIINSALYAKDTFFSLIEDVATEETTVEQILEEKA